MTLAQILQLIQALAAACPQQPAQHALPAFDLGGLLKSIQDGIATGLKLLQVLQLVLKGVATA